MSDGYGPKAAAGPSPGDTPRDAVIRVIRSAGKIARIDIAKQLGISPATVTALTGDLMASGLIEEVTTLPRPASWQDLPRGRPRVA
ncbi:MAG: winged helix-turn-helix domain-containing protein, partial [Pseudomonadota bacterium]